MTRDITDRFEDSLTIDEDDLRVESGVEFYALDEDFVTALIRALQEWLDENRQETLRD